MEKDFSTKWKASKQPRKQRKYLFNMPLHLQKKVMSAPLDKILKQKHKIRNIPVRKGDTVMILRGKFKGRKGKVSEVELQRTRISLEGITRSKKDGNTVPVWFHPSKVLIKELKEDRRRLKKKNEKEDKNARKEK